MVMGSEEASRICKEGRQVVLQEARRAMRHLRKHNQDRHAAPNWTLTREDLLGERAASVPFIAMPLRRCTRGVGCMSATARHKSVCSTVLLAVVMKISMSALAADASAATKVDIMVTLCA